jgi:hypothetical protein
MVRAAATSRAGQEDAEPSSTATAAERFVRDEHIGHGYSPWRHIALTLSIAVVIAGLGATLAARARAIDWLLMPVFFVVANFIEWAVHRYPMHRPLWPRILYANHARLHHIAFTDRNMTIARRELPISMPWYTMIGIFAVTSPVMPAAAGVGGRGWRACSCSAPSPFLCTSWCTPCITSRRDLTAWARRLPCSAPCSGTTGTTISCGA